MPKCVDCGTETARDVMYGPPDELRCRACVDKLQERYAPPTPVYPDRRSYVVLTLMVAACWLTILYWTGNRFVIEHLLASPFEIWDGQLWRFLTASLLHGDLLHLGFNLYWLWMLGRPAEEWMGSLRFAGFVALTAIGSGAAQFLAGGSGIGLSGVGYALFGLLFALREYKDFAAAMMQPQVVRVFVGWFFIGIALTYAHVMNIGNTAHGSGAVIGWLLGRAVLTRARYVLVPGVVVLVAALTGSVFYASWVPGYAVYQGYQAQRRGEMAAALDWYRQALRDQPDNAALRQQVNSLERIQKFQEKSAP